jgi:ubiquitin-activating enzyme E1
LIFCVGYFKTNPSECNNYLSDHTYLSELAKQPNVQLTNLQTILSYLVQEKPLSFTQCIQWATTQFEIEYNHKIKQLLHVFPADSKTTEGKHIQT